MSEIDPLERILGDLAGRGYDAAKLGVARNVIGRLAKFAGEKGFGGLVDSDISLFLERVVASGASERAVGVFRIVLQDAAPSLAAFRSEAEANTPPVPSSTSAESDAAPPVSPEVAELPPTPPLPEFSVEPTAVDSVPPPGPPPALLPGEPEAPVSSPPESIALSIQNLEAPVTLQVEPLAPLPPPERVAEPSLFDRAPQAPLAPDLPSGIDWGTPADAEPAVGEPEPLVEVATPTPPADTIAPPAEAPPTVLAPLTELIPSLRPSATDELMSFASPQSSAISSIPFESESTAPFLPMVPGEALPLPAAEEPPPLPADLAPLAATGPMPALPTIPAGGSPLPPMMELPPLSTAYAQILSGGNAEPGIELPNDSLPSLPAAESPVELSLPPAPTPALLPVFPEAPGAAGVDWGPGALPPERSDADLLLEAAASLSEPEAAEPPPAPEAPEPGIFAPRPTMMTVLEEPASPPAAEGSPVDVPADLVRKLTPRPTAEIPHQPANVHFEQSASDLLGTPPRAEVPEQPIEDEPRDVRRALVRDNLHAVLPTLLGHLESSDRGRKLEAIELLREAGDDAVPALTDALLTASPALATELFGLLAEGNRPEVAREVVEHLKSESADPLGLVAAGGEPAIRLLLSRLSAADELDREVICGCIEGNPDIAVGPLLEAVDGQDDETRGYALRVLGLLGRVEAVPGLAKGLESPDDDTRASSAMALVSIGRPSIDAIGEVLLRSSDPDAHYEAAKALGFIGHPSAVPYLVQAIAEKKIGHTAADSLVRIGLPSRDGLVELLDNAEGSVRNLAVDALARLGDREAIPALRPRLHDDDLAVREAARSALETLGVPFEELITPSSPESAPPSPVTHEDELARIRALSETGDLAAARRAAAALFDQHPDDIAAGRILADIEVLEGDQPAALATIDRVLRKRSLLGSDELASLLIQKAKTLDRLGQRWDAIGALDQLLFVDDSNDEARALHDEWSRNL